MATTPITGEVWAQEDADRQRGRDFLLAEARKPLNDIKASVEASRSRLLVELEGVSEAQAAFAPPGGEGEDAWGIAQVLAHLATNQTWITERVKAIAAGETPQRGQRPVTEGLRVLELVELLHRTQQDLLTAVDAIDGSERLDVLARHPHFGELNCCSWFRLQALHEEDHARQVVKIKSHREYPTE